MEQLSSVYMLYLPFYEGQDLHCGLYFFNFVILRERFVYILKMILQLEEAEQFRTQVFQDGVKI